MSARLCLLELPAPWGIAKSHIGARGSLRGTASTTAQCMSRMHMAKAGGTPEADMNERVIPRATAVRELQLQPGSVRAKVEGMVRGGLEGWGEVPLTARRAADRPGRSLAGGTQSETAARRHA